MLSVPHELKHHGKGQTPTHSSAYLTLSLAAVAIFNRIRLYKQHQRRANKGI